jgi:hypothetical protein
MDSTYTKEFYPCTFGSLNNASQSGDYKNADDLVESINGFQKRFGSKVRPSDDKITAEILYNKFDILQNCITGIRLF